MQIRFRSQIAWLVAVVFLVSLCFVEANGQRRRRRSSRRVAYPTASPSATPDANAEPKIVSTADQNAAETDQTAKKKPSKPKSESDPDEMRQTIIALSNQVTKLSEKLTQMEEQQRALVDMERLTRAEQRADGLSAQLRDVQAKEAELQMQIDQLEFALQHENIERVVGTFGTTHPEDARDQRRRQLENQRTRVQAQLNQLTQSRVRLEASIATADAEVDLLRKRIDANNQQTDQTTTSQPTEAPKPKPPEPPL